MKQKQKIIKCVVAASNSNGDSDFYFVKVRGTQEQFDNADHYEAAKNQAENDGYEPYLVYDQIDYGFKAFSRNAFDWKNATIVEI